MPTYRGCRLQTPPEAFIPVDHEAGERAAARLAQQQQELAQSQQKLDEERGSLYYLCGAIDGLTDEAYLEGDEWRVRRALRNVRRVRRRTRVWDRDLASEEEEQLESALRRQRPSV